MFATRYFPLRYFTRRFWPPGAALQHVAYNVVRGEVFDNWNSYNRLLLYLQAKDSAEARTFYARAFIVGLPTADTGTGGFITLRTPYTDDPSTRFSGLIARTDLFSVTFSFGTAEVPYAWPTIAQMLTLGPGIGGYLGVGTGIALYTDATGLIGADVLQTDAALGLFDVIVPPAPYPWEEVSEIERDILRVTLYVRRTLGTIASILRRLGVSLER